MKQITKIFMGLQINFLIQIPSICFRASWGFPNDSHDKFHIWYTFSRATKDQLNAHKPDTVTMSLKYYPQSSNYSINFYQATLTEWQRPLWMQFLEPCFLFMKKEKEKRMPEKRHLVCADKLQKIKGKNFENQGRSMGHE